MPVTLHKKSIHKKLELTLVTDPVESAKTAGLRYVCDDSPGIRRQSRGKGFSYIGIDGKPVRDASERDRINSLAIPPAWKNVWICPIANGHLQATGRDAKGRKQYRYHAHWQKIRSQTKFNRMISFSAALPIIREQIEKHLSLKGLPREKVLATVVRLLETTCIRVGNVEYAQENQSFGLTTLRNRHVDVSGSTIHFQFKGKSGVKHNIEVNDRRLAKIIKRCQELPGHELFQYIDEDDQRQTISSEDVNNYLREMTGEDFTAKDFRTWAGTVLAARELKQLEPFDSKTQANKNITQAIKAVAKQLGNRPATCRKYYVHPAVIDAYLEGTLSATHQQDSESNSDDSPYSLRQEELAVVAILEQAFTQLDSVN
jgi:DNA topoisomerase I